MAKKPGGISEPFFQFKTIYGSEGNTDKYMTRILIGWFRVHIFHRGDNDPDPHDHPWDFITFPLVGYHEAVYKRMQRKAVDAHRYVKPFRFHYRKATHIHRVLNPPTGKRVITLVIRGPIKRDWGFWVPHPRLDTRIFRLAYDYIHAGRYGVGDKHLKSYSPNRVP